VQQIRSAFPGEAGTKVASLERSTVEQLTFLGVVPGAMSDFIPCGLLVAGGMTERPDLIIDRGREYSKAWMGKKVAVYYEVR
jgi:hypothetical protein